MQPSRGCRWLHLNTFGDRQVTVFNQGLRRLWSLMYELGPPRQRKASRKVLKEEDNLSKWRTMLNGMQNCRKTEFWSIKGPLSFVIIRFYNEETETREMEWLASNKLGAELRLEWFICPHVFSQASIECLMRARCCSRPWIQVSWVNTPTLFPSPGLLPWSKSEKHVWHQTQTRLGPQIPKIKIWAHSQIWKKMISRRRGSRTSSTG